LADEAPPAEHIVALEQGISIVERTLLGLPARCRQVFLLRVSHELGYEAIAERLGLSKRTVEREMQQALEACEQNLKNGELRESEVRFLPAPIVQAATCRLPRTSGSRAC
jgi:RNA polymerase sigma-70 factor (ECF subfamily)